MKLKKSHVNIGFLVLILSLSVAGAVNQNFKPKIIIETPRASDGEITIITPENKTYTEPDSGYYPATYGFENDVDASIPQSWVDNSQSGCSARVVSEKTGHKKVVHLDDDSGNKIYFDHYFPAQTHGTIELWVLVEDATYGISVRTFGPADHMVYFTVGNQDKWRYTDSTGTSTIIPTYDGVYDPVDNTWYHLTIHFRCNNSPNFMGLSENSYKAIVDGMESVELEASFGNVMNSVDRFDITTTAARTTDGWVDAIGFSWDQDYNVGDNKHEGLLLSYDTSENLDWKGYSLDGQANKTIQGNSTIPMPSEGRHKIQVFGNTSIGTIYESNTRYFSVDTTPYIDISTPENKTYTKADNGYYPGTYGFESDEDGTIPVGWVDFSTGPNCHQEVESSLDNHNKVLKIEDASTTYSAPIVNSFPNQTEGTIELWFQKTVERTSCYIVLEQEAAQAVVMAIDSNNNGLFGLNVGGVYEYVTAGYSDYEWFHIRIDFDCGSGKIDVYINNVLQFENKDFYNAAPNVSQLRFSSNSHYAGTYYVDAVSYSWDPHYIIGDNYNGGLLLSYDSNIAHNWTGYSLDGATNKTILGNTTIPMPSDGQHRVQVFGNDSIGNMYESEVRYFEVDVYPVDITIISPTNFELFQDTAPGFEIFIDDPDLNSTWYSLDGGITTIPFTGFTGTIEQSEWNKLSNGTVTIGFYANDSVNNIGYASVTVRKDVLGPIITVSSPQVNEVFGVIAPYYDLSIVEHNLDSIWYSFDYGVSVFPLFSLTGTLDQAEWGTKGGGTVPIRFYANDSLGHESFTDVTIIKDLTLPLITINSPGAGEVFGYSPPYYDISITESNLNSYWYTIDSGATNISISSLLGTIDQTEWDKLGNGTLTIRFHAEDEGGNKGFAEIIVRKDINIPLITINSPITTDILGLQPPQYDISVVEPNIDAMWYTLDSGAFNVTFSSLTGTIDQTEWNKFGDGIINIRFYIRDEGGNEAFAEVSVNKDLIAPIITINEPELGDIFVDYPPIYSITIDETSLYSFWYSLDDGQTNYSISELTGAIGQDAWDSLSDGHVTLRFYAKDEAGNVGQSSITITKRTTPGPIPPGIPGYNLIALIGVTLAVTLLLAKRKRKK